MGSGTSVSVSHEAVTERVSDSVNPQKPKERLPKWARFRTRSDTPKALPSENHIISSLQQTQERYLRCRMRPVSASDLVFLSQRACAQFMFRMPGVNDGDASILKRMLGNAGKNLTALDSHCVFVVEGSGLHEDLLACAAVAPRQRDCYRWQRAISTALADFSPASALQSFPLDAIFSTASAAKIDSKFDKHFRNSLNPLGLHDIGGTLTSGREVLARFAEIANAFEDAARCAAFDLELLLRDFSVENSELDPSILHGKRIVFAASNAKRSRGYAVTTSSQHVLWYRPSCLVPLGNAASFGCKHFADHLIPRISRPLPPVSTNPALWSNDVIMWEGLYKQLCIATECAVEAILCQHQSHSLTHLVAPPLVSRIERGELVFIFLQETPPFGVTAKHAGQRFGGSEKVTVVLGLDSNSNTYKQYNSSLDSSTVPQFTALYNRKLYADSDTMHSSEGQSSTSSLSSASSLGIGAFNGRSRVDSCTFCPGLVAYSIPVLQSDKKNDKSRRAAAGTIFVQPMWSDLPLISVSWTSQGRALESISLTLPSVAVLKFCVSCGDDENHPNFGAAVSVSCDVNISSSNVRSRPGTASQLSQPSRVSSFSTSATQMNVAELSEKRWSVFASSSLVSASQSLPQWANNAVQSLCWCVEGVNSCVGAIVSSVEACFSSIFDSCSKTQLNPSRGLFELFLSTNSLRDSFGCRDLSFLPMILKQMSIVSKASLGVVYADLLCRVSADAIYNACNDGLQMRLALQRMYSLTVDELTGSITKLPAHQDETKVQQSWEGDIESWWQNTVSVPSCVRALNLIKMLPLFQAEFGTARGNSLCILETLLQNVWYSSSNFTAESPKKHVSHLTRAEFYGSWIRAMAARTLQLLFLSEPIDWIDENMKRLPSPCQYRQPHGWYAHIHHKASVQKTAAFLVLDASQLHHHELKGDQIVHAATFCETFCQMRFLLSSNFVSRLMHSRSVDDTYLPRCNRDTHKDPNPHVTPREFEPSDDFLPKPLSSSISRHQQNASALLDVGPLNFNARSQRVPLASTFGSCGWITPVYISPLASDGESSGCDKGLEFINRIPSQSIGSSTSFDEEHSRLVAHGSDMRLSEPQSILDCMRVMHGLALKLLNISFVMELQFALNALADVFMILGLIGSVHFDRDSGAMLPLNRRSSKMCRDMAATLYLRSMSSSRLNTGAAVSMFRMMCDILSNGQAMLETRNFMPFHFRDFLLYGDVNAPEVDVHTVACVALTDALFAKILNTLVVWTVAIGFELSDQIFVQTCKRAELCHVHAVKMRSLDTGDAKKPLEWVVSALACPLIHTYSTWLSACNPEAPLNDVVVVSSTKSAYLVRATAQVLANAYASAIAACALPSTPLDVSCALLGYASLCCKFFGEWANIEKSSSLSEESSGGCCPCQLLYGIVACNDLPTDSPSTDTAILSRSLEDIETQSAELSLQELSKHLLLPCMCDMLALFTHHAHGDKFTSYDPALLCFGLCPSRAFCDVSFLHLGQYCSDSTMLLAESSLGLRKFKKISNTGSCIVASRAKLLSLNASSCMFIGDKSLLALLSQSLDQSQSKAADGSLKCLCIDGCLSLTRSFMSELSLLPCVSGLEVLVMPSFDQNSVLMGDFTQVMQQKLKFQLESPLTFDEFSKCMKFKPETRNVIDQLGYRSVEIIDPSLEYISKCGPDLSDALQALLLRGRREDAYSAHNELMGRFAVATAWCREMRKEACKKEAIMFERNRTKMFAENQWRQIDRLTGKVKSEKDEDQNEQQQQAPAIQDGSTNLWASNEKIMNVSVMMGRLEKIAQATAVVRDLSSSSHVRQFVSKDEVFNSVMESFDAIKAKQNQSQYVSLSGDLMMKLRRQKKDFFIRQLSTRACIRTALLHRHVRISARLCVAGQGPVKAAALMHIPSQQSAEYCQLMLSLVANSFEGPGCDGETIVELLRCTPNLLHLSFVRAHPWSSSRLLDLMALRMSKTLLRMRQMWALWDDYKIRLGRMSFQRSIHYERVPVKESIVKDHVGFHDRHCIIVSKYLPKLVLLDLGGLKHVSDMGRSAFFFNCPQLQVVSGSEVNVAPVTNECLLALASRMLPPFAVLFTYLTSQHNDTQQIDVEFEAGQPMETHDALRSTARPELHQQGMIWSLEEHIANQIVHNMSLEQREAAAKAKAELLRKERLLREVAFRQVVRRNVLHCKAAIVSHQGRVARLNWMKLNEMANFDPALRDTLGVSAALVMAPVTGSTRFGEPRYEFADCTPSMIVSALLRIRFQVVQLSPQCCQTSERIERNLQKVKDSNRDFDDPFLSVEEIFGDPSAVKDPCQVLIRVAVDGKPDRRASKVPGLRLSHEKYQTVCTAGPIDIRSIGDCSAPIMMRQTGYLVIPDITSRILLEIRTQSKSGKQMITATPHKRFQMPRVLDQPQEVKIDLKYAPKLEENDELNRGLQQAYYQNKQFILNGGIKVGYVQVEMTVMSPWQVDLMVAQNQAKKNANLNADAGDDQDPESDPKNSQASQGGKNKKKNLDDNFDPNNTSDCMLLAESSVDAFPFRMRLYDKYDRGNFVSESLLMRERRTEGDDAVVRCRAPVGLVSVLVEHPESWFVFKQRKQREREELLSRWVKKSGFVGKFTTLFGQDSEHRPQSKQTASNHANAMQQSTIEPVPVSLEGLSDAVDARVYLVENRDQDSDFDDVDEPEELELSGQDGLQTGQQLMLSSIGRLVEYCVDSVTAELVNDMTFRRAPFGDFRHMRCLELDNSSVTDKFFLDCFDLFIGLRSVSIAGCKRLTSASMLCIAQSQSAPCLQFLDVSRVCDWRSEIVAALCNTAKAVLELRMDYIITPTLTDGCVLLMSQNMKGLRLISLNGVQSLANESVSGLMEQARNLRSISIAGLGLINDVALQYAHKCNCLTFLEISFAILVTDEGLRHIARCRQLCTLLMQNLTAVTDEGLVILGNGCGRLQSLDVIGCERLTPRGPDAVVQLCPLLHSISVDATPAMRDWKGQVEGTGSTSNVRVLLNFAAPS